MQMLLYITNIKDLYGKFVIIVRMFTRTTREQKYDITMRYKLDTKKRVSIKDLLHVLSNGSTWHDMTQRDIMGQFSVEKSSTEMTHLNAFDPNLLHN